MVWLGVLVGISIWPILKFLILPLLGWAINKYRWWRMTDEERAWASEPGY